MNKNEMCITMLCSTKKDYNFLELFKNSLGEYIIEVLIEESLIKFKFFDGTFIEIKIADEEKTKIQLSGMINYYSKIDINNEGVKNNVIKQIQISNNLLYISFDGSLGDRTATILECLFNVSKRVGAILIFPNYSIFDENGKLLISNEGKTEVEQFFPSVESEIVIDNESEYSEDDKRRIEKNISFLKEKGISYNENMKLIPTKSNTKLDSKLSIFIKLQLDYLLATMAATFPGKVDQMHWDNIYETLDILYNLKSFMLDDVKEMLDSIKNNTDEYDKTELTWLYEECAISLWILNLWDFPSQETQCDVNRMNEIMFMNPKNENSFPDLFIKIRNMENNTLDIEKLQMKSYEEILEKADLLNRYKWALDDAEINKKNIHLMITPKVLMHQLNAFCDILDWDLNEPIK